MSGQPATAAQMGAQTSAAAALRVAVVATADAALLDKVLRQAGFVVVATVTDLTQTFPLVQAGSLDLVLLDATAAAAIAARPEPLRQLAIALPVVALVPQGQELSATALVRQGVEAALPRTEAAIALLPLELSHAAVRHRQTTQLRRLLQRASAAMVVIDAQNQVVFANPAALQLFGANLAQTLGPARGFTLYDGLVQPLEVAHEAGTRNLDLTVNEVDWNGRRAHLVCAHDMSRAVQQARTLETMAAQLGEQLTTDALANVLNRKGLEKALTVEVERMRRAGANLSAVLVFLSDLARINSMSRESGQAMVKVVADAIAATTRPCDHVGRVSDDTFLILLPDTRLAEAMVAIERLKTRIAEQRVPIFDGRINGMAAIPVATGVGAAPSHTTNLRELFDLCRDSMRAARADVKSLLWNTPALEGTGESESMPSISLAVHRAAVDDLRVLPHRIMRLSKQEPAGAEFLIRGPPGPLESPAALFAAAGDARAVTALDLHCLRTSAAELPRYPQGLRYHFNLFPTTLLGTPVEEIIAILTGPQHPATLCIELSEQRFVGDPALLAERLARIKAAGIEVAIDDIGFGRSSLEVLIVTEPQIVKIDRGHIKDIARDPERQRLLRRFVDIIHSIKASIIAEGIETREDLQVVAKMGIAMGQGWLWGKPGLKPGQG